MAVWNTVYGELRFAEVMAAAQYHDIDDFETLQTLLLVLREEMNKKD